MNMDAKNFTKIFTTESKTTLKRSCIMINKFHSKDAGIANYAKNSVNII